MFCKKRKNIIKDKEVWKGILREVKYFIIENRKMPDTLSEDLEEKKMAFWIFTQKNDYENKKNIMKDDEIRKQWENSIYKIDYFDDIDDFLNSGGFEARTAKLMILIERRRLTPIDLFNNLKRHLIIKMK